MTEDFKSLCGLVQGSIPNPHDEEGRPHYSREDLFASAEDIVRNIFLNLPHLTGGPRFEAGEWSRRNVEALAADVLGA